MAQLKLVEQYSSGSSILTHNPKATSKLPLMKNIIKILQLQDFTMKERQQNQAKLRFKVRICLLLLQDLKSAKKSFLALESYLSMQFKISPKIVSNRSNKTGLHSNTSMAPGKKLKMQFIPKNGVYLSKPFKKSPTTMTCGLTTHYLKNSQTRQIKVKSCKYIKELLRIPHPLLKTKDSGNDMCFCI